VTRAKRPRRAGVVRAMAARVEPYLAAMKRRLAAMRA
jgi:hypothetical protein